MFTIQASADTVTAQDLDPVKSFGKQTKPFHFQQSTHFLVSSTFSESQLGSWGELHRAGHLSSMKRHCPDLRRGRNKHSQASKNEADHSFCPTKLPQKHPLCRTAKVPQFPHPSCTTWPPRRPLTLTA